MASRRLYGSQPGVSYITRASSPAFAMRLQRADHKLICFATSNVGADGAWQYVCQPEFKHDGYVAAIVNIGRKPVVADAAQPA
jgi:hypothetical protein